MVRIGTHMVYTAPGLMPLGVVGLPSASKSAGEDRMPDTHHVGLHHLFLLREPGQVPHPPHETGCLSFYLEHAHDSCCILTLGRWGKGGRRGGGEGEGWGG